MKREKSKQKVQPKNKSEQGQTTRGFSSKGKRKKNIRWDKANRKHHYRSTQKHELNSSLSKNQSWFDRISLTGSLLGVFLTVVAVTQITIWLTAIGKVIVDQNHVEMINQVVNQSYESFVDSDINVPVCVNQGENRLTYVVCDDKTLVAVDEYDATTNLLSVRRFYVERGSVVLAIDRYEYNSAKELAQKQRVIFQKILGVYTCSYLETIFNPTGISLKTSFHGSCGSGKEEVPTHSYVMSISPPPITLFMPYR